MTQFEGQLISDGDRITFGMNTILLYVENKDSMSMSVDWEIAEIELQKEIELLNKVQDEQSEKRIQEEMSNYKKNLEEKFHKEKVEIEEKLLRQSCDYEDMMKMMCQSIEKTKIVNERKHKELLMQEKLKILEQEKNRKKREYEQKERAIIKRREVAIKQQEIIHKSEKLEQNLHNVLKKLNRIKIMIQELRRNVCLEIYINKNSAENLSYSDDLDALRPKSLINIMIRVENYEQGSVYYWTIETFQNRYDLMKQIFDKYQVEDFDIFNLTNDEDPLWDEHKPILVGHAFYKLEALAYLISNPSNPNIVSPYGECHGTLIVDILPFDEDGKEFEDCPEDIQDLVGTPINFDVYIKEANDLPENFCRGVYVEYTSLNDNFIYQSKIIEEKQEIQYLKTK